MIHKQFIDEPFKFLIGDWKLQYEVSKTRKFTCKGVSPQTIRCMQLIGTIVDGLIQWETIRTVADSVTWNGTKFISINGLTGFPIENDISKRVIVWYSPSGTTSKWDKVLNGKLIYISINSLFEIDLLVVRYFV